MQANRDESTAANRPVSRRVLVGEVMAGVAIWPAAQAIAQQPPTAQQQIPARPSAEQADVLLDLLKRRFPNRLDEPQWLEVRAKLAAQLRAAAELKSVAITAADEPASIFRPVRRSVSRG